MLSCPLPGRWAGAGSCPGSCRRDWLARSRGRRRRLERWISWSIAERPDPDQRQLPLGTLALQLAGTRRGHANLGDDGSSAWLFPGGRPGQPISAFQLTERLRQIGIRCGQARSAALFQLATELPAAVLARMLGIHIAVAVAWQRACSGDWASYAAEVARRPGQRTPEQT